VAQNAYCNECATRIRLSVSGECPNGHPRSALRDVREGEIAPAAAPVPRRSDPEAGTPNLSSREEAIAKTMGRLVVIVPAVFVIFIGLYTGYAAGVQFGQSKTEAWLWSIGSMILTGLIVAVVVWDRRRKLNR
jgi:uncharacterized membrane protein (DUF485 family)